MCPRPDGRRVVGIDVGGPRKGFHAVALQDAAFLDLRHTRSVNGLVRWCRADIRASVIAIDAPCRWSKGGGRSAERELLARGIRCFSTPTRRIAQSHPGRYYDWMLHGEALFRALEKTYSLVRPGLRAKASCCFETFPHAVTWQLRGGNADAAKKRTQRLALLHQYGCATRRLTNMDWIDAALCAVAADMFAVGRRMVFYGDPGTGFIVFPEAPLMACSPSP